MAAQRQDGLGTTHLPSLFFYAVHFGKKCVEAIATLFFVAMVTFLMGHAIPGGPFDSEKYQPPQIKKLQEAKYGLDKPLWKQFGSYMGGIVFHGDFGVSMKYLDRPVGDILLETLPLSLSIGGLALLASIVIGLPLGMLSALKPNSWWDSASLFMAVGGVALPTFLIGAVLVLIFCRTLEWLPPARLDTAGSYVLPVLTLAARPRIHCRKTCPIFAIGTVPKRLHPHRTGQGAPRVPDRYLPCSEKQSSAVGDYPRPYLGEHSHGLIYYRTFFCDLGHGKTLYRRRE